MKTLRIWLFGNFRLEYGDTPIGAAIPLTAQCLLAYLLLHRGRSHNREVLAELIWGERGNGKARRCLNTALWRLRCALESEGIARGTYLIATPPDGLRFNCDSDHWLDVAVFEERARQLLARPQG